MNTKQFEFDAVVEHLFKQGGPATVPNHVGTETSCSYRGRDGTMCAVGCRIPNIMYRKEMEGKRLGGLITVFQLPAELEEYLGMFSHLQDVHDSYTYEMRATGVAWNEWLNKELASVAKSQDLQFKARV